jgi:hypothetical protein
MRNPDSLSAGEPGCKENIEQQHLNCSSLHFASRLSRPYRERLWWRAEARCVGTDWSTLLARHLGIIAPLAAVTRFLPACDTCGSEPCVNSSFCEQCRRADARLREERRTGPAESIPQDSDHIPIDALWRAVNHGRQRATPQTIIEAIMYCVCERGLAALTEPANLERLMRCDEAAKEQIDRRIAKLVAEGRGP